MNCILSCAIKKIVHDSDCRSQSVFKLCVCVCVCVCARARECACVRACVSLFCNNVELAFLSVQIIRTCTLSKLPSEKPDPGLMPAVVNRFSDERYCHYLAANVERDQ